MNELWSYFVVLANAEPVFHTGYVAKADHPNSAFTFTFERNGLINWKLNGLAIPSLAK